jgi:hypothetical protein
VGSGVDLFVCVMLVVKGNAEAQNLCNNGLFVQRLQRPEDGWILRIHFDRHLH